MKKAHKIGLSLIVLSTLNNVYAESTNVGEISVTATKTQRFVSEVPASINIITEQDINSSVATSADELLKNIAGVDFKHSVGFMSTGTTNKITLRGFGGGTEGRTLLLVDGIPMNDSYFSGVEWNQIAVDDIKRIEVVKGAGSALYGSNALGGVINIITKKPKKQKTDISFGYGSLNTKIGSATMSDKIGNFGYYISGQLLNSEGYMADYGTNLKSNSEKRGADRQNATVKVNYDIDDTSSLGATYLYFHNKTLGVFNIVEGYNPYDQKMNTYQARYTKTFENDSDLSVTLFKKLSETSYDSLNSAKTSISYADTGNIDEFGGTLQYTYPLNAMNTITAGIDFQFSYAKSKDDYSTGKIVTVEGNQDYQAVFLQDEIFIGKDWVINIGGRVDSYKNHSGKGHDETQTPTSDTTYASRTFTAFSPKVGVLYHLTKDTSIKGSVGKAFRAPTIYDLYRTWVYGSYVYASNPNLDPETVVSYELGIEQNINDRGVFSVTAYQSDAKDFIYSITPDPAVPTQKEKKNVGKVQIRGIETEFDFQLTNTLKFNANYTFNESVIKEFKENTALENKFLTDVPKHKASFGLAYQNPNIINAKTTVRYVGDRYSDDANTESKIYKSYTMIDLKLSKKLNKNTDLEISVDDLFNSTYKEYYVSPGRVILATLKVSL